MYRRTLGLPHHSTTSIRTVAAPGVPKAHRLVLGRRLLLLSTLLTMFAGGQAVHPTSALAGNGAWPSSTITTQVGGDYVDPSAELYSTTPFTDPNPPPMAPAGATTSCNGQGNAHSNADWSWLQTQCWNPPGNSSTAKSQLMTELGYITQHRLGTFQRVWVSMDQLGSFNGTTFTLNSAMVGTHSNPGTLLQALQVYHDFGIQVDLVLFTYSPNGNCGADGKDDVDPKMNVFNPLVLNGTTDHAAMMNSYVSAVGQLMGTIAGLPAASNPVAIVDLQNEAYYQMEQYFCTDNLENNISINRLGNWAGAENSAATCDSLDTQSSPPVPMAGCTGCKDSNNRVDRQCVDIQIVYPWLRKLYDAAHTADSAIKYTVSSADTAPFDPAGVSFWRPLYDNILDLYDIHAYSNTPWNDTAVWNNALSLDKDWFVGEAGCGTDYPNGVGCTYDNCTTNHSDADTAEIKAWWLANLPNDGAKAVLSEETNIAWCPQDKTDTTYHSVTDNTNNWTFNSSGRAIARIASTSFIQGFDGQAASQVASGAGMPGTRVVGPGINQFSSATVTGASTLSTASKVSAPPNSQATSPYELEVTPAASGSAYVTRQQTMGTNSNYFNTAIDFFIQLKSAPSSSNGAIVLAQMGPNSGSAGSGTTDLVMAGDGTLFFEYTDSASGQQTILSTYKLDTGPHEIGIERNFAAGNSTLSLYVDCQTHAFVGAVGNCHDRPAATGSTSGQLPAWTYLSLGQVPLQGASVSGVPFRLDDVSLAPESLSPNPTGVRLDGLLQQMHGTTTPHLGHTRGWLHARPVPAGVAPSPVSLNVTPLKLSISHEGIYRITYRWLQSHNINLDNVDAATLGLSDGGVPVPVFVSSTGSLFQSGDYIEFYGHPVNNTYNASNVYVLSDTVAAPLQAVQTPVVPPLHPVSSTITLYSDLKRALYLPTAPGAPYTTSTAWPSDGDAHWTEGHATVTPTRSAPTTLSFPLVHAVTATGGSCFLTAPVYGQASQGADGSYTLQTSVTLNGNALPADPSFSWTDPSAYPTAHTLQATFPCSWLVDSSPSGAQNTLTVSVALQPGSPYDSVWVQSYHVGYGQSLCAQASLPANGPAVSVAVPTPKYVLGVLNHPDGSTPILIKDIILNPQVSAGDGYTVQGFSQAPTSLWRVTNGVPSKLIGWQASPSTGTGGPCNASPSTYDLAFADAGSTASVYVATAAPADPDSVAPLDLNTIANGGATSAQYLIITPSDFIPTLTNTQLPAPGGSSSFVDFKSSQMSTKVVDVNSIYDQFSNGQVNPEAIRTYITAAHASLGTKFVLLVGGDTYDYQNYYNCPADTYTDAQGVIHPFCGSNLNNRSFIPSLYTGSMQELDTPSDNLLAVPLGAASDAPQVAIGRMPVYTTAELQTVLTKSMNWPSWLSGYGGTASFVAHNRDGDAFRASSEQLIADLAPSFTRAGIARDYLTGDPTTDAGLRTSLISAINNGQELVNWTGHASSYNWGSMVSLPDVLALTNVNKPAAVFEWGCQTAYYLTPYSRDISSTLLVDANASGPTGAAITVGSTGQDLIDQQAVLSGGSAETGPTGVRYFYGYLSQGKTIGEALQLAKDDLLIEHPANSYANPDYLDVVNSYEVFGDPSLTLP